VTPKEQLDECIDKYTPEIARVFRDVLKAMRRLLPGATEMVYDNYGALGIGFAASQRGGIALSIVAYPRWVSLFFLQGGAHLDDPSHRLRGSGRHIRHVVLTSGSQTLQEPDIQALIQQAIAKADPPLPQKGRGKIIIKLISVKQRPRRPSR
jgi:hypothetical protein